MVSILRQTHALIIKNLLLFKRTWFFTTFRAFWLPIIFVAIIAYAQNLFGPVGNYGISTAIPVKQLKDTIEDRMLIYYPEEVNGLTDEIRAFMANVTTGLPADQVVELDDPIEIFRVCRQTLRGSSTCYGAVEWLAFDSEAQNYTYNLRADAGLDKISIDDHKSDAENYILPLQWAIDSKLLGLDVVNDAPMSIPYTSRTAEEHREDIRQDYMKAVVNYMSAVLYLGMIGVVYDLTGAVATERQHGLTTLLDCMGCSRYARHLSFFTSYSGLYIISWAGAGAILSRALFRHTSIAIIIVYHLLSGFANVSWSLFLAQPFRHAQVSGIASTGLCVLMAIMALVQRSVGPFNGATSGVLGFLFPPMNYVYFIAESARADNKGVGLNLLHVAPDGYTATGIYWIGSVIQIFGYFFLAIAFEIALYGRPGRASDTSSDSGEYALVLKNVFKTYKPWTWPGLFRKSRRLPPVEAVKDLSVSFRAGEMSCLLGANGSGKTTTLEMIAGIQSLTAGTIQFGSSKSLGICPQRNVLWDNLTAEEHVRMWTRIKGSDSIKLVDSEVSSLLENCDLQPKKKFLAKNLSGGQKRKLQLAAMFAGDSKVCCIDEVSSGLDPISRRKIWDILIASRGERSIILTTHFLDEADILADNVAILVRGELKAHGSPVSLKEDFGNGYRVFSIAAASGKEMVYEAQNGNQVIDLINRLEEAGAKNEIKVSGPQLVDVFLKLVAESDSEVRQLLEANDVVYEDIAPDKEAFAVSASEISDDNILDLKIGSVVGIWGQIKTMVWKRLVIARHSPLPSLCIFVIPIIVGGITRRFVKTYEGTACALNNNLTAPKFYSLALLSARYGIDMLVGPQSALSKYSGGVQAYLKLLLNAAGAIGTPFDVSAFANNVSVVDTYDAFIGTVNQNYSILEPGGAYFDTPMTLAYRVNGGVLNSDAREGLVYGPSVMNFMNNIRGNGTVTITAGYTAFQFPWGVTTTDSLQFVVYFSLAMSVFPAFCALYPTVERTEHVRALHYSNGLQVLPLWLSYLLLDLVLVLVSAAIYIGIFSSQVNAWFGLGYLFVVAFLYGTASILVSFIISLMCKTQLASFAFAAAYQCAYFLIYLIVYLSVNVYVDARIVNGALMTAHWVMALFAPVASLVRGLFLSLNLFNEICDGEHQYEYYGNINAYGGPILYLTVQIMVLFGGLLWWDSGRFRLRLGRKFRVSDSEEKLAIMDEDLQTEIRRVENPDGTDGLRVVHLSKQFGKHVAVEDVSFGVARGECFALLGPNGAGKSTTFNLIRGEIAPSGGEIFVEEASVSSNRAAARTHLGVCPQFDAIDRMSVDETLEFYARLRGLKGEDMKRNVDSLVHAVGLDRFRTRMSEKLSGGNRRKLSLGIALMANPTVLLLDEPSSGMDAASKRVMWQTLANVAGNRSIVLTTHSMEEADALASRAGIIAKNMLAVGTSDRLRDRYGDFYYIHFVLQETVHASMEDMEQVVAWARVKFAGHEIRLEDTMFHGQVKIAIQARAEKGTLGVAQIFRGIEEDKAVNGILYYSVSQASLEQVFLKIVGRHQIAEEGYSNSS
ncbi:hypothetical protein V1512DRAFT_223607 [Lipomyces arxii]|uniref:uncharacterized protein n=1 Tax=Lipomyces arxii TaxID=56418 RepID=UPI0034CDC4BF